MKNNYRIISVVTALITALGTSVSAQQYTAGSLKTSIDRAIQWKESHDGNRNPGTDSSDWYTIALQRYGGYNGDNYYRGLEALISSELNDKNTLGTAKNYAQKALVAKSIGEDPGQTANFDLISEGTYYNEDLGQNGAEDWIWALLSLDCDNREIPYDAMYTRDMIINNILSTQNPDGGVEDSIKNTALSVIALSGYYDKGSYTVVQNYTEATVEVSPRESVEAALSYLSDVQLETGDFGNCENTAFVLMALDAAGVDVDSDIRFIKNNKTVLDGLMDYQSGDYGFVNYLNYDNTEDDKCLATSYALCAMVSGLRERNGKAGFFDFNARDYADATKAPATPTPAPTAKPVPTQKPTDKPASTQKPVQSNTGTSSSSGTSNSSSSSSNSSSSSSGSSSTKTSGSSNASSSSSASKATTAPKSSSSSSSSTKATQPPTKYTTPTLAPKKPTATATPSASAKPGTISGLKTSPTPSAKVKKSKKPLVGPVLQPGPMPSKEPSKISTQNGSGVISDIDATQNPNDIKTVKETDKRSKSSKGIPITLSVLGGVAIIGGAGAFVMNKRKKSLQTAGTLPQDEDTDE